MQYETDDISRDPTMRLIDCPGLAGCSADLHLSRHQANLTLDSSAVSRQLRRVEYSNSLLVTDIEQANPEQLAKQQQKQQQDAAADAVQNGDDQVKAVTRQHLRGIYETEPCRAPFEVVEAVLRPSSLSMDELECTTMTPRSQLVTLRALHDVSLMSRPLLVQYLKSRAALFCKTEAGDDYYVRFLEPSLLKSAVVEICKFLAACDSSALTKSSCILDEDDDEDDEAEQQPTGTQMPAVKPEKKEGDDGGNSSKSKKAPRGDTVDVEELEREVADHFSAAQFPLVYSLAFHYMCAPSVNGVPPAVVKGAPPPPPPVDPKKKKVKKTLNLGRVVPILALEIINRAGALTKQSLAELWESCVSEYWFLEKCAAATEATASTFSEALLHGQFAIAENRGVVSLPHSSLPFGIVARIAKLFEVCSKWDKQELYAYLLPIGDSKKAVDVVLGKRCRDVKDKEGNLTSYLV